MVDEAVKITITKPDRSLSSVEYKPNQHGDYVFEITPITDGPWNFVIEYRGDSTYASSILSAGFMAIPQVGTQGTTSNLPKVSLELHFPSIAIVEVPINITVTMDPFIMGAVLNLTITDVHTGSTTFSKLVPNASGDYLYTFTPTAKGGLELKVEWSGNETYAKSECIRYLVVFAHGELDTSVDYTIMEKISSAPYITGVLITSMVYPSGSMPMSIMTSGISYRFYNMTPGEYTFSFTKPGYINATDTVTVREGDQQHRNVFLEKVGSSSTSNPVLPSIPGYHTETIILGLLTGFTLIYLNAREKG